MFAALIIAAIAALPMATPKSDPATLDLSKVTAVAPYEDDCLLLQFAPTHYVVVRRDALTFAGGPQVLRSAVRMEVTFENGNPMVLTYDHVLRDGGEMHVKVDCGNYTSQKACEDAFDAQVDRLRKRWPGKPVPAIIEK